jgi:hypothetical protein
MCTTIFNVGKVHFLTAECIYVFSIDLRTNSYYFPNSSSWFVLVAETECVYCGERSKYLSKTEVNLRL